jgi:hypothetical protein
MPRRNKERLDPVASSQQGTDRFSLVDNGRQVASRVAKFMGIAHQMRFRAPDRREIKDHAKVTGQAEAPRVRNPVSIANYEVRLRC